MSNPPLPLHSSPDTVFALATGHGVASVAIVRISGAKAHHALRALTRQSLPPPRYLARRCLYRADATVLDNALVVRFDSPHSFTGEDCVELHVHGSTAVVRGVLDFLAGLDSCRLAFAGEFTRRAFANGRLDLIQAEALADLLVAETDVQHKQAMKNMAGGGLSDLVALWRDQLIDSHAELSAFLEFPDDIETDIKTMQLWQKTQAMLMRIHNAITHEMTGVAIAERINDGFNVVLLGAPNVGKSTLLNALAKRNVALTSDIAGTTRDALDVAVDIRGYPVRFIDTAGVRSCTDDILERRAIARALDIARVADMRVFLVESLTDVVYPVPFQQGDLVVQSKIDINPLCTDGLGVSATKGIGLDALVDAVYNVLQTRTLGQTMAVNARQHSVLVNAQNNLDMALTELTDVDSNSVRFEIVAHAMTMVLGDLDALLGRTDIETMFDRVFSRFCIGK